MAIGIEQADRGELFDDDDVFAELENDIQQIEAKHQHTV